MLKEDTNVYGKDANKYKFMSYIRNIINAKDQNYDQTLNNCVIMPDQITPLHLFVFFKLKPHVILSLEDKASLTPTKYDLDPLSIAIQKDLKDICVLILKNLIKHTNIFQFSIINKEIIKSINTTSYSLANKFYNSIFKRAENYNLPKLSRNDLKTPKFIHSDILIPERSDFLHKNVEREEKSITFFYSTVELNLICGSSDSIQFLKSVYKSPNKNMFQTQFIKLIIADKWSKLKWYMYGQAFVYSLFLLCLSLYSLYSRDQSTGLNLLFVLNVILSFNELFGIVASPGEYFSYF